MDLLNLTSKLFKTNVLVGLAFLVFLLTLLLTIPWLAWNLHGWFVKNILILSYIALGWLTAILMNWVISRMRG